MAFDTKILGEKLRRYREQLQLSLEEVAEKTGIIELRLQSLEGGLIEPTGDEILIFSDFYKQDYVYFISNQQKAASEQIDILYRQYGRDFSKEDRWAIQEFMFLCECEELAFKATEFNKIEFEFIPSGDFYKTHGQLAAAKLRGNLGFQPIVAIPNPYQALRKLGIHIFRRKLSNSNISGLFIAHPVAGKCILINYSEDIYRQNFTLMHEIAHAIFDYKENINVSYEHYKSTQKLDLREVRANEFASSFLIPKEIFSHAKDLQWTDENFKLLAKRLQVNAEPLSIAMMNAGAITSMQQKYFKALKLSASDKIDSELKDLTPKMYDAKSELLQRGINDFYVRKCYEAYNVGAISSGRLADMLLSNENELVNVLNLFNLRLSYDN
ncbi:DNA-binding protein [Chitinophaga alhagiae]|uniref:DNA-binding protein n=1 Tax=Chitinophaga alhagiae TaxID=2203219 RepID=A0ABM6WD28_9BACT|nr:XRE family transcriptional regulator [Chitinophaga alhagiae]AWO01850.1 DNA-binding protein [Chitinophaga alhagiae]